MSQTETKKALGKMGLYLVSPEQKPVIKWPTRPKDAFLMRANIVTMLVSTWKLSLIDLHLR